MFHSYSHVRDGEGQDDDSDSSERDINYENGQQALQELFRKWDFELTDSELNLITQKYFKPSWTQIAGGTDANIGTSQSVELVRSLIESARRGDEVE